MARRFTIATSNQRDSYPQKPIALVVLLENVGHIVGLQLPHFVMSAIDYVTEEYAKLLLRYFGAYRVYDTVTILEDELATGSCLTETILSLSRTHCVDLLLLVHGKEGRLVGYRGQELIGSATFNALLAARRADASNVDLRVVFGLNCYGASLSETWLQLGATVVNGTPGVNWLPEPSLSVFLRNWFRGQPYTVALERSNRRARRWGGRIWRHSTGGVEHPKIRSSRQAAFGTRDITIDPRA